MTLERLKTECSSDKQSKDDLKATVTGFAYFFEALIVNVKEIGLLSQIS